MLMLPDVELPSSLLAIARTCCLDSHDHPPDCLNLRRTCTTSNAAACHHVEPYSIPAPELTAHGLAGAPTLGTND